MITMPKNSLKQLSLQNKPSPSYVALRICFLTHLVSFILFRLRFYNLYKIKCVVFRLNRIEHYCAAITCENNIFLHRQQKINHY
jgi:hypothetical protein